MISFWSMQHTGHLNEALVHYNRAIDLRCRGSSVVDIVRTIFDGLNKLQTEWFMCQREQWIGEVKSFQTLLLCGLSSKAKDELIESAEFLSLLALNPKIMNHDVLRRRDYRPEMEIEPNLRKEAAEVHYKLENAFHDLERVESAEVRDRVVKRLAELLYIVRSNIAHGEKTPYGPDLLKKERDEQVCVCIVPLLELLFDLLLDQPSKRLVSYGTLAPGQPNNSLISHLNGEWEECAMQGTINQKDGLMQFSWLPNGSRLIAKLFTSEDLPNNWCQIDMFEGEHYRRHLIPTEIGSGITVIANSYVASSGNSYS